MTTVLAHIRQWAEEHPRSVWSGFFVLCLAVGWAAHGDYGVSADEPAMLSFGQDTILHLFYGAPAPTQSDWNFHGPAVQALLAFINDQFAFKYLRDVWLLRHFLTFVLFLCGVGAFAALAGRLTGSMWWALLGAVWLLATPRVFVHAFVNPKDIPALTTFTIAVLTLVRLLERPTAGRIITHAIFCGLAISLRPFALLLPMLTVLCLLAYDRSQWKHGMWTLGATALCTVAVWPMLWRHPVAGLWGALTDNTSRAAQTFYFGQLTNHLPWHYVPVWMGITIPLLYTGLFVIGTVVTVHACARHPIAALRQQTLPALALLWFFVPLLAQIVGHIGIFDEWRHLLFLYPAFLLLALIGALWLYHHVGTRWHAAFATLLCIGTLSPMAWMLRHRGLQQMYMSVPSSWVVGQFEGDYWGLSYKQGLEWVLVNDDRASLSVYGVNRTILDSAQLLPGAARDRLALTGDAGDADYILDTYRWSNYAPVLPDDRLVHAITVDGLPALGIYRGPDADGLYPRYGWQK